MNTIFPKLLSTAAVLFFLILPFLFYPFLPDIYEQPKVVVFIISVNVLFVFFILFSVIYQQKTKISPLAWRVCYLFLWYVFVYFTHSCPDQSLWGVYFRYQGLITHYSYLIFLIVFSNLLGKNFRPRQIAAPLYFSGLITSICIIIEAAALRFTNLPVYTYYGRLAGFSGNANFAAGFLCLSFIYAYFFPFSNRKYVRLSYGLWFPALWLTGSRSGMLALICALGLAFIMNVKKKAYVLIAFLVFVNIWVYFFPKRIYSPVENLPFIWDKAVKAIMLKPLFGWGLDNFEYAFKAVTDPADFPPYYDWRSLRVDKAHNEWLEQAVAGGLGGLVLYLSVVVKAVQILWKNRQKKWAEVNLLALLAFFILSQLNVVNINAYLFFYLILATAGGYELRKAAY